MDKSILNQFRMTVMEKKLGVYGVVVHKKGEGTVTHRWRSDDRECLYSGSKTFTSVAVGMCRDENRLTLTDRLLDFFPEYKPAASEGTELITLRDLLHMASGKAVNMTSVNEQVVRETDMAELFLREPLTYGPGETFHYSNGCTYMLGRVVEKVSGLDVRDYLMPRLFDVMGIYNPQWHRCRNGHSIAASGLYLRTEEFARLGEMLMNKGVYNGARVVSESYLRDAETDLIDNAKFVFPDPENKAGYGYQLWRCTRDNTYRADGLYGQFSIVLSDKDAVVTLTGHEETSAGDILRAVYADIAPQL